MNEIDESQQRWKTVRRNKLEIALKNASFFYYKGIRSVANEKNMLPYVQMLRNVKMKAIIQVNEIQLEKEFSMSFACFIHIWCYFTIEIERLERFSCQPKSNQPRTSTWISTIHILLLSSRSFTVHKKSKVETYPIKKSYS